MKQHSWIIEIVDGGPVGEGEFWKCSECGASGGSVHTMPPVFPTRDKPFLAGPAKPLPLDCDEAKKVIAEFNEAGVWISKHTKLSELARMRAGRGQNRSSYVPDRMVRSIAQSIRAAGYEITDSEVHYQCQRVLDEKLSKRP